jgi:hypothetical protein
VTARLSPLAFDVCCAEIGAADRPYPLDVPHHGATLEERARLRDAVFRDLQARRLARSGRLEPDFEGSLRTLAGPRRAIEAIILPDLTADRGVCALAASNGRTAVLAVLDGSGVLLEEVPDSRLVAIVANLTRPPSGGRPVTYRLPLSGLQPGCRRRTDTILDRPTDEEARHGADARTVREILARPRIAVGQFSATGIDRLGRRQRSATLDWFATVDGPFASRTRIGPDGEQWITLSSAGHAMLTQRLGELLGELP